METISHKTEEPSQQLLPRRLAVFTAQVIKLLLSQILGKEMSLCLPQKRATIMLAWEKNFQHSPTLSTSRTLQGHSCSPCSHMPDLDLGPLCGTHAPDSSSVTGPHMTTSQDLEALSLPASQHLDLNATIAL